MKKLLEVREFDKISCNPEYTNEYAYLPEPAFRDLENFIHAFAGDEDHADALDFLKISFRRNVGDLISVNNYVGLIQLQSGYQIQILPKIDFGSDPGSKNKETRQVFLRMLRSMKDFPCKVFHDAALKTDRMTLYEIFINMYLQEVRALVKHGLRSAYIPREGNLNYYKGKLSINDHIKQNTAHGERFFVRYDEFQADRSENRIVKATLMKLQGIASSYENQKEIRQLLTAFEMVKPSLNHQKEFSRIAINRNTRDYEELMRWSRIFLLNKSFSTFSGGTNARALLFPMEKVFESFVAKQLKEILMDLDWEVSFQERGFYLFDSPRQFALRPDIVITRDDGSIIILDTKWKRLVDRPGSNYGISQSDMYQMYAYSKKYSASEIWLLYPVNPEMRGHEEISFKSDDAVTVRLFFVDVADIENSLRDLRSRLAESHCGFNRL